MSLQKDLRHDFLMLAQASLKVVAEMNFRAGSGGGVSTDTLRKLKKRWDTAARNYTMLRDDSK